MASIPEIHDLILRLAHELAIEVEMNHMPDEMAECVSSLVALYKAGRFVTLPTNVTHVMGRIEADIKRRGPYVTCFVCQAVLYDAEDLREDGNCPVCGGDVVNTNP